MRQIPVKVDGNTESADLREHYCDYDVPTPRQMIEHRSVPLSWLKMAT